MARKCAKTRLDPLDLDSWGWLRYRFGTFSGMAMLRCVISMPSRHDKTQRLHLFERQGSVA